MTGEVAGANGCTRNQTQKQPERDRPAPKNQKKYQSVVISQSDGTMKCPECSQAFSGEAALRDHVFQCRIDHGVDPLLQLHIVRRLPSASAATPSSHGRRALWNGQQEDSADLDLLMRPIHFVVEQRNLMAPQRPRNAEQVRVAHRPQTASGALVAQRPAVPEEIAAELRVLDLRQQVITTQGASLIQSSLAPTRCRPLPIEQIYLEGCVFETEDAERCFITAALSNNQVERVVGNPSQRSKQTSALWTELEQHLVSNRERSAQLRAQKAFAERVEEYKRWGDVHRERRSELLATERHQRDDIRIDEHSTRETFAHDLVNVVNRQLANERRQMLRLEKDARRREFIENEYLVRCSVFSTAIGELRFVCVLEETENRKSIHHERERLRQTLWITEREDVFRSKIMEQCRMGYASLSRLKLESHHAATAMIVEQESVAELESLVRQRQRHKQHSLWRRRKREEVEMFIRAEKVTRDGIEKEEDSFFTANREKLHRTMEMIFTKYSNQREMLSLLETNTRDMRESNCLQWFSLSLLRFNIESRVVKQFVVSSRREAQRRSLIEILPTASLTGISGHGSRHIVMFCAATPAHDPSPAVPLFPPQTNFKVTMPTDWTSQMQDAEAKCRASVADEKTTMMESMQVLANISKSLFESKVIAFDLSIDEINRRLQLSRLAMSGSPSESTLTLDDSMVAAKGKANTKSIPKKTPSSFSLPTEPVTEPHFLKAAGDFLRWRAAFADKSGVNSIRAAKENVSRAEVRLWVDSTNCDGIAHHHRINAATNMRLTLDGETREQLLSAEQSKNMSTRRFSVEKSLSQFEPNIELQMDDEILLSATTTSFPKPADTDGAVRELLLEIDVQRSEDSDITSPLVPEGSIVFSPKRYGVSQVTQALQQLVYGCLVDGSFSQAKSSAVVTFSYRITVDVAVMLSYGETSLEVDAFGYSQALPPDASRTVQLTLDGKIDVCVVPSLFCASLGDPRLLVEKQMEEVPLFLGTPPLQTPRTARYAKDGTLEIVETPAGAFTNAVLKVEVFTGSVTNADRLSIRDDLPRLRFDVTEQSKSVSRLLVNGTPIADVVSGVAQSTKFVTPINGIAHAKPTFSLRFATGASFADAVEVLQRLRYHNFETSPWEGRMRIRSTMTFPDGLGSSFVDGFYDIEHIDKPTELRLTIVRHTFRSPLMSCLPLTKQCAVNFFVPLFSQCVVFDEDTSSFSNGFIRVMMSNWVKGDSVVFVPDSHVLSILDEALEAPRQLSMTGDNVLFEGVVVATLSEGRVATSREVPEEGSGNLLHFHLAGDNQCSIAAVQAILRNIAFCSGNQPTNSKGHNVTQQRDFVVDVQIMDNEQSSKIRETVSVRGAGHSVQLAEKSAMIEYKEGNPPTRLPNTDLSNDRIKPITTFAGGYILCTVAEYFEDDVIALKPEDSEFKLVDHVHLESPTQSRSQTPSSGSMSLAKKLRAAMEAEEKTREPDFADVANAAMKQRNGLQDIVFAGMVTPLATVQHVRRGILIHLHRDTKRDVLTRKHVVSLMRSLTFMTPNPRVSSKTLRLVFCDDPSHTPSQVLITVDLESVDDVMEIRMRSPKKRVYLQPAPGLYPLLPYGRCMLFDGDTDYLDGGHFFLKHAAGNPKGDVLAAVIPSHQRELPVQRFGPPTDGFTLPAYPDLALTGDKFVLDGKTVGVLSFSSKDGGMTEAHIAFGSDGTGKLVPLALASYMINSFCFANNSDRVKDMTRQYLLLIRDSVNPLEGKLRISLDLALPVIAYEGTNPFVYRMNITPNIGSSAQPGSRIVVQADPLDVRNMIQAPGGSVELLGAQRSKFAISLHPLFYEELQLRRHEEDGRTQLKNGTEVMNITFPSPTCMKFTFGQLTSAKPFVNRNVAQSLLRYVNLTVLSPLDVKPPPVFAGLDGVVLQSITCDDSARPDPSRAPPNLKASVQNSARKQSVVPGSRARLSSMSFNGMAVTSVVTIGPEDDDDVNTLTLVWRLHDGQNLSTLISYIIPKTA